MIYGIIVVGIIIYLAGVIIIGIFVTENCNYTVSEKAAIMIFWPILTAVLSVKGLYELSKRFFKIEKYEKRNGEE